MVFRVSPPFIAPEDLSYPERQGVALDQLRKGETHEPDFLFLKRFRGRPLHILDVGANIGNSLASIAVAHPTARVEAFEPNPGLWPVLESLIFYLPGATTLHRLGLSDATGEVDFYIPVVDQMHIVGEASVSLVHFEDPIVEERLKGYSSIGRFDLVRTRVKVVRYDDIAPEARPDLVKIDVEGLETQVIRGMTGLLTRASPALLIESDHTGAVDQLLASLGYEPYAYHPSADLIAPRGAHQSLNTFYMRPDNALLR